MHRIGLSIKGILFSYFKRTRRDLCKKRSLSDFRQWFGKENLKSLGFSLTIPAATTNSKSGISTSLNDRLFTYAFIPLNKTSPRIFIIRELFSEIHLFRFSMANIDNP